MRPIASWRRVEEKNHQFAVIFGYFLVAPIVPTAVVFGPQEESDAFEAKLDRCISDKVDYFAEEYGYNSKQKREEVAKIKEYFV